MVSYSYDSWGRPLGMTDSTEEQIGSKNPFRYREYFYDAETGLYYISSRYYDPEVGRWINADTIILVKVDLREQSNPQVKQGVLTVWWIRLPLSCGNLHLIVEPRLLMST